MEANPDLSALSRQQGESIAVMDRHHVAKQFNSVDRLSEQQQESNNRRIRTSMSLP
jgi:hypothetical protein